MAWFARLRVANSSRPVRASQLATVESEVQQPSAATSRPSGLKYRPPVPSGSVWVQSGFPPVTGRTCTWEPALCSVWVWTASSRPSGLTAPHYTGAPHLDRSHDLCA